MDWNKIKSLLKKAWQFIWYEDSILSWMVNIVIAFVLIKFIIYPGIGLVLGTQLPVVAVISESMDHNMVPEPVCLHYDPTTQRCTQVGSSDYYAICGSRYYSKKHLSFDDYWSACGKWYEDNINITKEAFSSFPMSNGFSKGDIIILKGIKYDDIKVGDVIVFQSKMSYPIIHRVVQKNDLIQTKGDHNSAQIQQSDLNEHYITKDEILGRAWLKIPYLGYIKIWFVGGLSCVFSGFQQCSF